jgi:ribosomal protein L10
MKTRERKQEDLTALTEQLQNSKSAMVVSFNKLTVTKIRNFAIICATPGQITK